MIGVRSFGSDPDAVARHVAAAVGASSSRSGLAPSAFPRTRRHGRRLPPPVATLRQTAMEMATVELPPFRAAVQAGVAAVTGRLLVPALDPDRLATVSPVVTHDLLRGTLGFRGTVITDALEMRAVFELGDDDANAFVGALIARPTRWRPVRWPIRNFCPPPRTPWWPPCGPANFPSTGWPTPLTGPGSWPLPAGRPLSGPTLTAGVAARAVDGAFFSAPAAPEAAGVPSPLVVECRTPNGMATGDLPWSLAERVAARLPGRGHLPGGRGG